MNCPHCGKEIENSINTIMLNMPANVNACNPVIPTFQMFNWNFNAVAGNPLLNGTVIDYTTCAAPAPAVTFTLKL